MAYQAYPSVKGVTLGGGSGIAEEYIPLWVHSSGTASTTVTGIGAYLQKGSTATVTANTGSAIKLHTLNSNWSARQKFVFEVSVYTNNASYTAEAYLYDITTSSGVSGTIINTTSTTATVLRSGSFTLVPGHVYAVLIDTNNSSGTAYLTKAHLVAIN